MRDDHMRVGFIFSFKLWKNIPSGASDNWTSKFIPKKPCLNPRNDVDTKKWSLIFYFLFLSIRPSNSLKPIVLQHTILRSNIQEIQHQSHSNSRPHLLHIYHTTTNFQLDFHKVSFSNPACRNATNSLRNQTHQLDPNCIILMIHSTKNRGKHKRNFYKSRA